MNAVLIVCTYVVAPLTAYGLYEVQARLERWDHDRHAED
jgi:hypothetical protein